MSRSFGFVLGGALVAFVATTACADLRELNTCRAIAYALCERAQTCSVAAVPSVEDCANTYARIYNDRAGAFSDADNACPSSAASCLDKIDSATCGGPPVAAEECGDIVGSRVSLPAPPTPK
jgi:hypothetical protein